MVPLCTFVHPTGKTCASPALRTRDHCYFHNPQRRVSGPRHPTTRAGYRWHSLYRKIPTLRREQLMPIQTRLVTAAINHTIPREMLFRILDRLNRRVVEIGNELSLEQTAAHTKQRRNSQNL